MNSSILLFFFIVLLTIAATLFVTLLILSKVILQEGWKNYIASFFKNWGIMNGLFALIFCFFSLYKGEKGLAYWNLNALATLIVLIILYTIGIALTCSHDWKVYETHIHTGAYFYSKEIEGYLVFIVFCGKCLRLRGFGLGKHDVNLENTSKAAEHEFQMFLLKNKGKQIIKLKKLLRGER